MSCGFGCFKIKAALVNNSVLVDFIDDYTAVKALESNKNNKFIVYLFDIKSAVYTVLLH